MRAVDRWRARGVTAEAMALIALARLLVARVPFARWRSRLGESVSPMPYDTELRLPSNLAARRLARAVERAAARLPGESLCLPQAMALQWLLTRRGMGGVVYIGVRPGHARGGLGDLHAWVVREGEVLIGASEVAHHPLFAATREPGLDGLRAGTKGCGGSVA